MSSSKSRVALFVDFDNIYLGLREDSARAAEEFATDPQRWLRWIEAEMPRSDASDGADVRRSILVRRCYLNPESFGKYRAYFTRSGFSVVDCPPLTTRGKTSADIVMVMDVLDALKHDTRFDEFIIMSGDADFTPVLHRLRTHDRRTAALVGGTVAPAYRAACDLLITEDAFAEQALGIRETAVQPQVLVPKVVTAGPELLDQIARRVYETASTAGTLPATELPAIFREFREFTPKSNWLGFFSLRSLTEALVARRSELQITEEDPWRVVVGGAEGVEAAGEVMDVHARDALRRSIVEHVTATVAASPEPVVMGRAAQEAVATFGTRLTETRWLGYGTFKALLLASPEFPFVVKPSPLPGFLYDAARHDEPSENGANDALRAVREDLAEFIRRVHRLTDVPRLPPTQYALLFELLARELNRGPYHLSETSRALRDQLVERGESVNRQNVAFVLKGLFYSGYRFGREVAAGDVHTPGELTAQFRDNVLQLLAQAQASPSEEERMLLDEWIAGAGREAESVAEPESAAEVAAAPAS